MDNFIEQLESVIKEYDGYMKQSRHGDGSDVMSDSKVSYLLTGAMAAIDRIAGRSSEYYVSADGYRCSSDSNSHDNLAMVIGAAKSLLLAMRNGYLKRREELIHADVFNDFLEMSEYLLSTGYKDAAAVTIGSVLEVHLKKLATKHSILTELSGKAKKADTINSDLVKAGAYNKLEQKSVTAWLGIRNYAAHGEYDEYDKQQVELMLSGVRGFMNKYPA